MFELFINFTKIGLLTFGGGSAAVPIVHAELIEKKKWLSEEEFADIVTIANILPGPSMVEIACQMGIKRHGKLGGIVASIAIAVPSIILFVLVMTLLSSYFNPDTIFKITLPLFVLIGLSMYFTADSLIKSNKKMGNISQIAICLLSLVAIVGFNISTTTVLLVAIICGIGYEVIFGAK